MRSGKMKRLADLLISICEARDGMKQISSQKEQSYIPRRNKWKRKSALNRPTNKTVRKSDQKMAENAIDDEENFNNYL